MISSAISSLLGLTTNGEWWVLAGLTLWVLAHLQLYVLGEKALGYVVTQLLAVIPVGICFFSLIVSVQRFTAKHPVEGSLFLVVAIVSAAYFLLGGLKNEEQDEGLRPVDKIKRNIKRLINLEVIKSSPDDTATKVMQLLSAAILILSAVALCLLAGWQLIQGSHFWGMSLGVVGGVLAIACRMPKGNPAAKAYSVLTKINKEIVTHKTDAQASVPEVARD